MQTSRGKFDCLPRTPAGFTPRPFDGCGLCRLLPTRPARAASDPVSVRQVAVLLRTSFRPHLAVTPLCFATLHLHQVGRGLSPPNCQTCSAYKQEDRPHVPAVFFHYSLATIHSPLSTSPAYPLRSAPAKSADTSRWRETGATRRPHRTTGRCAPWPGDRWERLRSSEV